MDKRNSLTDCAFFLAGKCMKGDRCSFRHCEFSLNSRQDCKKWANGECRNPRCKFRHPQRPHAPRTAEEQADIACHWYSLGKCSKGDDCPFKHDPDAKPSMSSEEIDSNELVPSEPVSRIPKKNRIIEKNGKRIIDLAGIVTPFVAGAGRVKTLSELQNEKVEEDNEKKEEEEEKGKEEDMNQEEENQNAEDMEEIEEVVEYVEYVEGEEGEDDNEEIVYEYVDVDDDEEGDEQEVEGEGIPEEAFKESPGKRKRYEQNSASKSVKLT